MYISLFAILCWLSFKRFKRSTIECKFDGNYFYYRHDCIVGDTVYESHICLADIHIIKVSSRKLKNANKVDNDDLGVYMI